MKKWRIVLSAILVSIAAIACGTAIGCKKGHSHSFAWEYDSVGHWRVTTCEHDVEDDMYGEHTPDAAYKHCSVCGMELPKAGIAIEKTNTEYTLKNTTTANIATDDIVVKYVTKGGIMLNTLSSDDYTLTYYKGTEQVSSLANAESGAYNIWATANVDGKVKESFVVVYVIDNVEKFVRPFGTFKTEQDLGLDEMSETWNFEVTYSSGKKETVNVTDARIERSNFSTFKAAELKEATVTFIDRNSKGEVVTKSVNVPYTINKGNGSTINTYDYDVLKNTLPADQQGAATVGLTSENFTGQNAFLSVAGGTVNYRGPSNNVLELRGDALNVTFSGVGLLEIDARSNSKANTSTVALKDQDGNYIMASYSASSTTTAKDDSQYIYSVTGDNNLLTFNIVKPGTYTICTLDEITVDGNIISTARPIRVNSITQTDVALKEAQ